MLELSSMLNLSVGDHLCCMYMTEEEHRNILVPFIRDGLEQGDKILYVVDARTAETILTSLDQYGICTADHLLSGQLVIAESRETYLRDGQFDPDKMLALLGQETDASQKQGFRALRITGEMSWALRELPGSDRLMEYEGKLNQFFPLHKAIGLCQYDMRRFQPEILLDVLATHPIAVIRNTCYENIYYVPPEEFLGPKRAQAELNRRIMNLEERRQHDVQSRIMEEELRRSEAQAQREAEFTNAILDNAGALIVVLDREGRIVRFNRTCELLTGYSAAEAVGQNLWDLVIPQEEMETTQAVFTDLSCGQFPKRLENEWKTRQGERLRVAWSNTCLLDSRGQVDLIVSIGLDITEISFLERAQKREFNSLQDYSGGKETSMTAASLGIQPLSQSAPDEFYHLVVTMSQILDQALEQSIYKVSHDISAKLQTLAETFGQFGAGPRDLVQAYVQALQNKTRGQGTPKVRAYTYEGRLLLIELMGYLAAYYFNHCLGKDDRMGEQGRWTS
jgi:PAS domain S-box-containing protein